MSWTSYDVEEQTVCHDAANFLQQVSAFSGQLVTTLNSNNSSLQFMYRGVSDSSHRLLPSALRTQEEHPAAYDLLWNLYSLNTTDEQRNTELHQRRAELSILRHFYQFAERAGLNLPQIPSAIRQELLSGTGIILDLAIAGLNLPDQPRIMSNQWPHPDLLPLLGLAQHYGLPTRLLDWSYSPFVAAYFAAAGGVQRLNNGDDPTSTLSVWASIANNFTNFAEIDALQEMNRSTSEFEYYPARIIMPPTSDNPNLALQQGIFTVLLRNDSIDNEALTERIELPERLEHFRDNTQNIAPNNNMPNFFRLHLPISESPSLLRALNKLGFSANRIFDGFGGASLAVKETAMMNEAR